MRRLMESILTAIVFSLESTPMLTTGQLSPVVT